MATQAREQVWRLKDSYSSPAMFTPWTSIHFLSGVMLYAIFAPFTKYQIIWALIVHALYEAKDLFLKLGRWEHTNINSCGDTIAATLGSILAMFFVNADCEVLPYIGMWLAAHLLTLELYRWG